MRIVVIIPARYGSTRFPGKPLARIAGKPMLEHVWARAAACRNVTDVVVATDDDRILTCVQDFGGKALLTRSHHASGTDRIAEAAQALHLRDQDIVVNVQGDQPLVPPSILAEMIAPFGEDEDLPMTTLMCRIRDPEEVENTNHVKVVTDVRGFALYFSRHALPYYRDGSSDPLHYKHLGLYAYRTSFLKIFTRLPEGRLETAEKLEQLRVLEHGYRIRVVETESDSPEVDTPEDVRRVEAMMTKAPPS